MVLEFSTWDEYELRIYTRKTGKWSSIRRETARNDMFRAESLNFIGAIEGTEENLCPISEARKSLAAKESVTREKG